MYSMQVRNLTCKFLANALHACGSVVHSSDGNSNADVYCVMIHVMTHFTIPRQTKACLTRRIFSLDKMRDKSLDLSPCCYFGLFSGLNLSLQGSYIKYSTLGMTNLSMFFPPRYFLITGQSEQRLVTLSLRPGNHVIIIVYDLWIWTA